jgi:hypothetical protein
VLPWLWLFLALEAARVRRRIGDGEVFLAGAAAAMLHAGIYAKDLQHGFHPLGIDWLGAALGLFQGGMTAVLCAHIAARLIPRRVEHPESAGLLLPVFLVFALGAGVVVYGVRTVFGFYLAERLIVETWLLGDLLFAGLGLWLWRRALERAALDEEPGREPWIWVLAAFVVWLPGARLLARLCAAAGLPDAILYLFAIAWTVAAAWTARLLWRERVHAELAEPAGLSRAAAAAALWRAAGALVLLAAWGPGKADDRAGAAFAALVELPSCLLFAWAFLTAKLKV